MDWNAIDRAFCKPAMSGGFGFTLDFCYEMTLPEVDFYLSVLDDKKDGPTGAMALPTAGPAAVAQQRAYAEWYWRLPPLEKLERALSKRQ